MDLGNWHDTKEAKRRRKTKRLGAVSAAMVNAAVPEHLPIISPNVVEEASKLPKLNVQSCRRLAVKHGLPDYAGLALCSLAWSFRENGEVI